MLLQQGAERSEQIDLRLACTLSAVAGALNGAALYVAGFFAANMTGNLSAASDHLALGNWGTAGFYLLIIAAFPILTATLAMLILDRYLGFHFFTNPTGRAITATEINRGDYGQEVLKAAPHAELINRFRLGMLLHGVDMLGWPGGPTSAVHTAADLQQTVTAFRETINMLRAEALL